MIGKFNKEKMKTVYKWEFQRNDNPKVQQMVSLESLKNSTF